LLRDQGQRENSTVQDRGISPDQDFGFFRSGKHEVLHRASLWYP
jgi:hypothetical protein